MPLFKEHTMPQALRPIPKMAKVVYDILKTPKNDTAMTCFLDRYNRPLRIVWRGITRVRLQDNRGNTMILTHEQLNSIL